MTHTGASTLITPEAEAHDSHHVIRLKCCPAAARGTTQLGKRVCLSLTQGLQTRRPKTRPNLAQHEDHTRAHFGQQLESFCLIMFDPKKGAL